jgi:hydroxyacylglutathione hydrolase
MTGWRTAARPVETTPQITVHELQARLQRGEVDVLDVRQPDEWQAGHVPGATHITGAELPDRHGELADLRPVAAICGSGYRSSVAASLLAHHGRTDIVNVTGGMAAWRNAGYPLTGK